ncbi:hypothetical protein CANINC_000460 [Pichia inconspicua]|uniref:ubiquitinyl hydrolase 1 n=1 Tax=Pichia inconspicua TaxID=52247 RepID=A0A4T0X638_9ASCO|nr:hypothetical protein CANINC_000460 [[Candida] inconspicua]
MRYTNSDHSTVSISSSLTTTLPSSKKPLLKQVLSLVHSNESRSQSKDPETIRVITALINLLTTDSAIESPQTIYKHYRIYKRSLNGGLIRPVGILRTPPHNEIQLIGMDNYLKTTCYLDALIVALFYSTSTFDYLLDRTPDPNLAPHLQDLIETLKSVMRFIVNLLRAGESISVSIMHQLLLVLNALGCDMALSGRQQDALQMFEFLAESLSLPLLTLKLDIIHTGTLDVNDDLKLIGERSLLISIPTTSGTSDREISLEECLNSYFNNSITVRRHLDQRKNTNLEPTELSSSMADTSSEINEYEKLGILKSSITTVTTENSQRSVSPTSTTPLRTGTPDTISTPLEQQRANFSSASVLTFSPTRKTEEYSEESETDAEPVIDSDVSFQNVSQKLERQRTRSSTLASVLNNVQVINPNKLTRRSSSVSNTEVTLPAWMYLQLLPYYTNPEVKLKLENHEEYYRRRLSRSQTLESASNMPYISAVGTAEQSHIDEKEAYFDTKFGSKRPLVPICLKRYTWNERGRPVKIKRRVSIPEIIRYPYFIAEDKKKDGYVDFQRSFDHKAPRGAFMLVLQSIVCHRGENVNSGHYVCIARRRPYESTGPTNEWILFNDLLHGREKAQRVTLEDAVANEDPYILFYEVVEIPNIDTTTINPPPGGREAYWSRKPSVVSSMSANSTLHEEPSHENSSAIHSLAMNLALTLSRSRRGGGGDEAGSASASSSVGDILDEYYWYSNEEDLLRVHSSTAVSEYSTTSEGSLRDQPEVSVMEVDTEEETVDGIDNNEFVESDIDYLDEKDEMHRIKSRIPSVSPSRDGTTATSNISTPAIPPVTAIDDVVCSDTEKKRRKGKVRKLFKKVFS